MNVANGAVSAAFVFLVAGCAPASTRPPIKVGILHSLTGTMALSETPVRDGTLLAIEEINADGGLFGRRLEPVMADGMSNGQTFAREAERLITEERVAVIFGCWTSASRKTVKPIIEEHDQLLFYPVQYEGLEQSPNIVYLGAAPNQQLIPAVKWCFDQGWKRFFLVASDYVFPRAANEIMKARIKALRGEVVGEAYLLLGDKDVRSVVDAIVAAQPDVILNTINGDTNIAFFAALRAAGVTPQRIPTVSFSIAEGELHSIGNESMVGDYAVWNYFESLETKENQEFVRRFRSRFGADHHASDPVEAAYVAVRLWARAVARAGTTDPLAVRTALGGLSIAAPEGIVVVDAETQHAWKTVRIGQARSDGQFAIIWSSDRPIRPIPYPRHKTKEAWETFLNQMFQRWGGRWSNPGNGR
jgi:urea transport system substrate-binding protein